jgi:nucleotide-binding universal stress UspA family protein
MDQSHIILATDGSPGSIVAARWTNSHLAANPVRLTLLHVMRMTVDDALHNRYQDLATESEGVLKVTADAMSSAPSEQVSIVGVAASAISHYAANEHADLIIVGHVGHTAVGGMGSITFEILHQASIPVLMVPPQAIEEADDSKPKTPLRIVLAVDGSTESEEAARWLNRWAKHLSAEISVFSATSESADQYLDPAQPIAAPSLSNPSMQGIAAPAWGLPGVYWLPNDAATIPWQDSVARARDAANDALSQAIHLLPDCPPVAHDIGAGAPAQAILSYADDTHADLIVMGRRGHSALGNLLGSVSYTVAQRSKIPVVMVPESGTKTS